MSNPPHFSKVLKQFTLPHTSRAKEERLLADFVKNIPRRYRTALVIGRFQPFHYGHLFLMKQALSIAKELIIGIGSSNIMNMDNPFPLAQRKQMLKKAFTREYELKSKIVRIVSLPDIPDDDAWLVETIKSVGNIDVVIGNNDWVNGIFKKAGYPVVETPLYFRDIYEGKKIRAALQKRGFLPNV